MVIVCGYMVPLADGRPVADAVNELRAKGQKPGIGSGFIVNATGLVVTADHALFQKGTKKPLVALIGARPIGQELRWYRLRVVKRLRAGDTGRDIALLQLESDGQGGELVFPFLPISDTPAQLGDEVLIAGYPRVFRSGIRPFPLFKRGIVASMRVPVDSDLVMLLDVQSAAGFSGSPVVSLATGTVLGVVKGRPEPPGKAEKGKSGNNQGAVNQDADKQDESREDDEQSIAFTIAYPISKADLPRTSAQ
jgi:hypothetical protein